MSCLFESLVVDETGSIFRYVQLRLLHVLPVFPAMLSVPSSADSADSRSRPSHDLSALPCDGEVISRQPRHRQSGDHRILDLRETLCRLALVCIAFVSVMFGERWNNQNSAARQQLSRSTTITRLNEIGSGCELLQSKSSFNI